MNESQPWLVALSGGVDSAVAAARLADEGVALVGIFMRNGVSGSAARRSCCSLSDARDAAAVARALDLPFYVHDLERPFARLIEDFARDYAAGLTPNPCIACNQQLKFGELLALADDLGCRGVATGHYAVVRQGRLSRAADAAKDQSYLLAGLAPGQLARARLPLGHSTKAEVRAEARRRALPVADKPDSAEICFVPGGDYRAVVRERLGHAGAPGAFVDESGRTLGRHAGVGDFTVGQRRGLGLGLGHPVYVRAIDATSGTITVARRARLARRSCRVGEVAWHEPPLPERDVLVQLRHHHRPVPARIAWREPEVQVRFASPCGDVSPGQYAAFYDGPCVLGAGRILRWDDD